MIGLTEKQMATLRFIAGFLEAKGRVPTLAEIASGIGAGSPSCAFYALRRLVECGAISRPNCSIEILRPVAIPRTPEGAPLYFVKVPQ